MPPLGLEQSPGSHEKRAAVGSLVRTLVPLPSSITPEAAAELLAMFATLSPADQNRVRDWMAELNAQGRGARR
ncbi:hypothetical protein LF1_21550 [Rubripirellula obstinata]|uniref:Uncharacterized protein n=1 Tax=Rubripirellula obstinata TaxID=406547 RepID=A0A5B1CHC8_9BACT|nr:hypothetical protein LF1_21550 [Rubripirellula obstinata]